MNVLLTTGRTRRAAFRSAFNAYTAINIARPAADIDLNASSGEQVSAQRTAGDDTKMGVDNQALFRRI
jgi:hypothetical protein